MLREQGITSRVNQCIPVRLFHLVFLSDAIIGLILMYLLVHWPRNSHSFQPDQLRAVKSFTYGPLEHSTINGNGHQHFSS